MYKYDKIFKIRRDFSFDDKNSGYTDGKYFYSAKSLIKYADEQGVETFELDLKSFALYDIFENTDFVGMAEHFLRVQNADLKYPVILGYDGRVLDGRHRIIKAIMTGGKVFARRLTDLPKPTKKEG